MDVDSLLYKSVKLDYKETILYLINITNCKRTSDSVPQFNVTAELCVQIVPASDQLTIWKNDTFKLCKYEEIDPGDAYKEISKLVKKYKSICGK